jgi:hypothetical protein
LAYFQICLITGFFLLARWNEQIPEQLQVAYWLAPRLKRVHGLLVLLWWRLQRFCLFNSVCSTPKNILNEGNWMHWQALSLFLFLWSVSFWLFMCLN